MTSSDDIKMNIVFMANIGYPNGMAGTKRVQNLVDHLHGKDDVHQAILVLRQSRVKLVENKLCGCHKGVEYVTIGGDIKPDITVLWRGVKYFIDGLKYLKANFRKQCRKHCRKRKHYKFHRRIWKQFSIFHRRWKL